QIAGTACSCLQFCQERHYIPDGVDYMAADHNVSREIIRGILPGSLETLDVGEFPLMQGLTQIVQHTSIWFNGGDMLYQWGKCQCKSPCPCTNIQHGRFWGNIPTHTQKERVIGSTIFGGTMETTCTSVPEICGGAPQSGIGGIHLLCPCIDD